MKYTESRELIRISLRDHPEGRTWRELRGHLALPYTTPCPEWVKRLELEIGLERNQRKGRALLWKLRNGVGE